MSLSSIMLKPLTNWNEPEVVNCFALETVTMGTDNEEEAVPDEVMPVMKNEKLLEIEKEIHELSVVTKDGRYDKLCQAKLYVLFSSILPRGEEILSVDVYLSDFKIQNMKAAKLHGDVGLFDSTVCDSPDEGTLKITSAVGSKPVVSAISAISVEALVCNDQCDIGKEVMSNVVMDGAPVFRSEVTVSYHECGLSYQPHSSIIVEIETLKLRALALYGLWDDSGGRHTLKFKCESLYKHELGRDCKLILEKGHTLEDHELCAIMTQFPGLVFVGEKFSQSYCSACIIGSKMTNLDIISAMCNHILQPHMCISIFAAGSTKWTLFVLVMLEYEFPNQLVWSKLLFYPNILCLPLENKLVKLNMPLPDALENVVYNHFSSQGVVNLLEAISALSFTKSDPSVILLVGLQGIHKAGIFTTLQMTFLFCQVTLICMGFHDGCFVWYAYPVYQMFHGNVGIWIAMCGLHKSIFWDLMAIRTMAPKQVAVVTCWQPSMEECCNDIDQTKPPLRRESVDLCDEWYMFVSSYIDKLVVWIPQEFNYVLNCLLIPYVRLLFFNSEMTRITSPGDALHHGLWSSLMCKDVDMLQNHSTLITTIALYVILENADSQTTAIFQSGSYSIPEICDLLNLDLEFSSRYTCGSVVSMATIYIQSVVHPSNISIMYRSGLIVLLIPPANSSLNGKSVFSSLRNSPGPLLLWEHCAILITNMHKSFYYMVEHMHIDIPSLRSPLAFIARQDDHCSIGIFFLNSIIQLWSLRCKNQGRDCRYGDVYNGNYSSHVSGYPCSLDFMFTWYAGSCFVEPVAIDSLMMIKHLLIVYLTLWGLPWSTCDVLPLVLWLGLLQLDFNSRLHLMIMENEAILVASALSSSAIMRIHEVTKEIHGALCKATIHTDLFAASALIGMLLQCGISFSSPDISAFKGGFSLEKTCLVGAEHKRDAMVLSSNAFLSVDDLTYQLVKVLGFLGMILPPPFSKLLTPFATICMVKAVMIIKAGQVMRMVYVVVSGTKFPTGTCARPEDIPSFKGGGMLGLICDTLILSWAYASGFGHYVTNGLESGYHFTII